MRTNMKKVLAILMTLVMLCGLLPLGMLSVSAAEPNLDLNFNDGVKKFDGGEIVSGGGPDGSDCFKWTASGGWSATYLTVKNMSPAKDYVITFKTKASVNGKMGITIQNGDWGSFWNGPEFSVTTSWVSQSIEIAANTYPFTAGTILFKFQDVGVAMDLYIDDLKIAEKEAPEVPAGTNILVNGDFETGSKSPWIGSSNMAVNAGAAYEGSYGATGSSTSSWGTILRQDFSLESNTEYKLSFWYKSNSDATINTGVELKYAGGSSKFAFNSGKTSFSIKTTVTSWTKAEFTFTTDSSDFSQSHLVFYRGADSSTSGAASVSVDSVVLAKTGGDEPTDPDPEEPDAPTTGENLVVNGSFENGNEGWKIGTGGSIVSGGYTGSAFQMNNSPQWGETGYQEINVEAHETYTLTWRSKRVSGSGTYNMNVSKAPYDGTTPTITALKNQMWMNSTSTEWIEHKASIKMTDKDGNGISKIMIKLTTEAGNAGVILIDDIVLTKNLTASFDGYIYNGDFEVGNTDNWSVYSGTAASTAAKYNGSYGAYLKSDGSWNAVMHQATVNVIAGKTYIVSYYYKGIKNQMGLQIKDGTTASGSVLASKTHGTGDWTLYTFEVTPSSNGLFINFHGSGGASADASLAGEAYVDDIKVELKGGNPEEKIEFGGSSIRDTENENVKGLGLAFQFKVSAEGATKNFDNTYTGGLVDLGGQKYTLVRMGAVMTNNATIGQNADNFNLSKVDTKKVIDIPAVFLCAADAESVSFAVRICDIPEKHIGTTIYARPYYVYLENGVEVTVYGDTRSNNYAKVANVSTADKTKPIRILSIGHSFSKDVMTTNLYNMFVEGGYEDITIGYLYMAGCSMPKHLYNIQNNLAQYEYSKNESGTWATKYNYTALSALQDEEWDFVTVQSSPDYIGGQTISSFSLGINNEGTKVTLSTPQTEYEAMDQITDWIKANATNANVKIDYHMIWSFSQDCELWSGMYHKDSTGKYNQMTMWQNITDITQQKVLNHEDINRVIPSATAIQNVRSSFMGDNFNMPAHNDAGEATDGYHLNDYGDYVAALTWYCHYSGDNAQIMAGYTDNGVISLTPAQFQAIAEAVNNATDAPYTVTESSYKTEG